MSGYWDNVESHKQRQKRLVFRRRLASVVCLLLLFWLAGGFSGDPPFLQRFLHAWRIPPADTEVTPPVEPVAEQPPRPEPDERLLADRANADQAKQVDEPPLAPEPRQDTRVARLMEDAAAAAPSDHNNRGELDLKQLRESLENLGPQEVIAAGSCFREQHPKLATDEVLAELVTEIDGDQWLRLAAEEADDVSPASGAFGAVWLPIAEAWDYSGDPAEAREAMRRARAAVPRMLSTNQQYAWFVDLYRDGLLQPDQAQILLEDAIARTSELADRYERRGMQAHLSGLASAMGKPAISRQLLAQVTDRELEKKIRERIDDYVFLKWRAWAASWHASSQAIEPIAQELERLNYRRMPLIGNAYAHAAMAAARDRNDTQFYRMALRAEAAFSQTETRSDSTYPHVYRLAEAYLHIGKWRHALVTGNNLTDPNLTASINFRVLASAPQDVDASDVRQLIANHGDDRYAPRGVASFVEHLLRNGEDPIELAQWAAALEQPALRASGYAGFARASESLVASARSKTVEAPVFLPGLDSPRSLIEEAERRAASLDDPLAAAAAYTQTARAWSLTDRQRSYQEAVQAATAGCLDAWADLWRQRPRAGVSYKGTYNSSDSGRRRRELDSIKRLLRTQLMLAQMQADLGDADGTLDTCLHLATTAGYAHGLDNDLTEWHYAAIAALLTRTEHQTGVGAEAIASRWRHRRPFSRAMTAAWLGEAATARSLTPAVAKDSHDKGHVARIHAELATFYARRGDLDAYRSARRTAYRESQQRRAAPHVNNVLAIADALAGEFALAQDTLTSGTPKWSHGASRVDAETARGLARQGDWQAALQAAEKAGFSNAGYRCGAFAAVAHARYQDATARPELVRWASELARPTDQIGALCGLALAADGVGLP